MLPSGTGVYASITRTNNIAVEVSTCVDVSHFTLRRGNPTCWENPIRRRGEPCHTARLNQTKTSPRPHESGEPTLRAWLT